MKIGLFGGSFDPVHRAHQSLARQAAVQFKLDRVIWIPAALSPFKKESDSLASPADRLAMVKLAAASEPRFEVSDYEIKKGGTSYSIDTLRHFQKQIPKAEFFWILGMDALAGILNWREPEALMRDLIFLVASRGKIISNLPLECKIQNIDLDWNPAASSGLKNNLLQDRGWEDLDPAVSDYIRKNHLYGVGV